MKHRTFDEFDVLVAVNNSLNYAEVLKNLGLPINGGNYRTIKRFIKLKNIDTSHFKRVAWNKS